MSGSRSVLRAVPAAALVAALAGTTPSLGAPPVKRLLQDADLAETLYVRSEFFPVSPWLASLHLLDDLDGDGVREVLLTHLETGQEGRFDRFRAHIRSLRTGQVFTTLTPVIQGDPAIVPPGNAHQSALLVDDLNGDEIRDIVASRVSSGGVLLQTFSGADGAELSRVGPSFWPWGVSMLPWGDRDADGSMDLLLGRTFSGFTSPLREWSPINGTIGPVAPDGLDTTESGVSGYTLLDLGVDSKGERRVHFTHYRSGNQGAYFATDLLVGEPLARIGGEISVPGGELGAIHAGAAILGDLNGDGVDEIVVTGQIIVEDSFGNPLPMRALPVLDGATGQRMGQHLPTASFPGATTITPNRAIAPMGDITGDGFNDYAVVAGVRVPSFPLGEAVLVQCGRTGQTIAAFTTETLDPVEQITTATPYSSNPGDWIARSHSLVSPGDLNDDGVNDLVVMMTSAAPFEPPISLYLVTHYLPTPCAGDTNFDRAVNFADLNAVLANFGAHDITSPADLNADGVVDLADLNLVLSAFGQSCD